MSSSEVESDNAHFRPGFLQRLGNTDALIAIALTFIGFVFVSGARQIVDIGLYDETNYLANGLAAPHTLPAAQDGPFYALWYYALSFFVRDRIDLYYFNYEITTVLPALAFFAALRAGGISRLNALLLSFWLLFCPGNFWIWPRISNLALTVLLAGLAITLRCRNRALQVAVMIGFTLTASYMRPEYFVGVLLLVALMIAVLYKKAASKDVDRTTLWACGIVLICPLVVAYFGVPITSGDRSFMAFGQHFALNWVHWHNLSEDPWTNWQAIAANSFGSTDSVWLALLHNPLAFGHHVLSNVIHVPIALVSTFMASDLRSPLPVVASILGSIALLFVVTSPLSKHKMACAFSDLKKNPGLERIPFLIILSLFIPGIISIIVIYPRDHYIFIVGVIALYAFAVIFLRGAEGRSWHSFDVVAVLIGLALFLSPPLLPSHGQHGQPNLACIEFLRGLNLKGPVNLLEAEGGFGIYVGDNYRRVAEYDKDAPFDRFLKNKNINLVLVSPTLASDNRFAADPQWTAFVAHPEEYGFASSAIPGVNDRKLIYKKTLIPAMPARLK